MTKIYDSVDQLIGKTPIVKLNHVVPEDAADVYVKLEFFNPAGSIKDRIALSMVEAAKKSGKLKDGQHRYRAGDGCGCQRISSDYRDARNDEH